MNRPTTFISYAYDSPEHSQWVRKLADDLISRKGIPVILDQYELEAGHELTHFMESSLEQADKVIVILTPGYKHKAGDRKGGAGFEYSMVSKEMMATQVGNDKFIPVLRAGSLEEAAPLYLQGRVYHDMRPEVSYEPQLHKLAMLLYGESEFKKPALGPKPDFNSPSADPLLYELEQLNAAKVDTERLAEILNSGDGLKQAITEFQHLFQLLEDKSRLYKEAAPGFGFYYQKEHDYAGTHCRIVAGRHTVKVFWHQRYNNTPDGSTLRVLYFAGIIPFNLGEMPPSQRPNRPLLEKEYSFDIGPGEQPRWKVNKTFYTTSDIVQEIFSYLVEKAKKAEHNQ